MQKVDIGKILSGSFEMYSKHWQLMLQLSAIIYVIIGLAIVIVTPLFMTLPFLGIFAGVVAVVLLLVAGVILQGMYVLAVDDLNDGHQNLSIGDLFSKAKPFLGPLMGTAGLVFLGVLGGFFLLIIPAIIFAIWWSVVGPVVVLEGKTGTEALRRSRELVKGNWWNVFFVLLIVSLLVGVVGSVLGGMLALMVPGEFAKALVQQLPNIITGPFAAIAPVLMYFQLRGDAPRA